MIASVQGGYSHEFTTAQVHTFLAENYGDDYHLPNPKAFAVFEDHLLYADHNPKFKPFMDKVQTLRDLQKAFQVHTQVRDYSAVDNISPGICHQVAREEFINAGDFIQATDSHTCMGGASNALSYGVGSTEYSSLIYSGFTFVKVPESIRFELTGKLAEGCTAKDVNLFILANHARRELTLNRSMEFGGPGLASLSMDERATLCNMATECSARTGICEADEVTVNWLAERRPTLSRQDIRKRLVAPDPDAKYHAGVHVIDLSQIHPMVAHPGNPDQGIPSDPTNGALIEEIGDVKIDIAYGGSCTAGKIDDIAYYAKVCAKAEELGLKVNENVSFFIQYGSGHVKDYAQAQGWHDMFERVGVQIINPGCGACIGAGPGVSLRPDQVTVSAINRNFQGRSGPGQLYLASPLTVATSAFLEDKRVDRDLLQLQMKPLPDWEGIIKATVLTISLLILTACGETKSVNTNDFTRGEAMEVESNNPNITPISGTQSNGSNTMTSNCETSADCEEAEECDPEIFQCIPSRQMTSDRKTGTVNQVKARMPALIRTLTMGVLRHRTFSAFKANWCARKAVMTLSMPLPSDVSRRHRELPTVSRKPRR